MSISANINNIPVNNWAKSDHNPTFRLKDIAKRLISDGEFSISLRQSRKKRLAHFVPIKEKSAPLPRGNVDPSHMSSEALAALSTLIDGEGRKK